MKTGAHTLHIIVAGLATALAVALCAVVIIPGLGGTPEGPRIVRVPKVNPHPSLEVGEPDAAGMPNAVKPVLPHELLTVPPPEKPGCFHLVDDSWQEVPCATEEEMKNIRRPVVYNSIQSTLSKSGKSATPIIWGAVSNELVNPDLSEEWDVLHKTKTPNTFSIQTNTNFFTCPSCKAGWPFKHSKAGDQGWVQFVYQQSGSGESASTWLCLWNIDVTVVYDGKDGYKSYCVVPSKGNTMLPLTGAGAPEDFSEVIGYVDCAKPTNAGAPDGCTLWAFARLPWVKGHGSSWWAVSGPDSLTLAKNWDNLSGTLYGEGDGSKAVFSNAKLVTWLDAFSCDTAPQTGSSPTIFRPEACKPSTKNPALTVVPANIAVTAESNNLVSGPISFEKENAYECAMGYTSTY
jgi:hypothetical protein